MAAVKAHEADRALARLDPACRIVLIYGPDAGLVGERAATLARASVDDPQDAFQLIRMDGDQLGSDPMRLVDEANTIGLFGGRRAIRVSATSKPLTSAIELLVAAPPQDSLVILEGGDLQRTNPLRLLCERARSALAVPCYADGARDLGTLLDETLRTAGKTIDRATRETLLGLLGGDRQTTRRELEKLLLYAGSQTAITMADVDAVIGDTAQREISALVDAVFAGQYQALDTAHARLTAEGSDQGVILGAGLRHALALLRAREALDAGKPARDAVGAMRLPFPRLAAAEQALKIWPSKALFDAIAQLGNGIASIRRDNDMARAVASRCLWSVARLAHIARAG